MSRVLKVLDEILYKYEGIQPQGFDEGGLATPKRGLVDEPGSYSGLDQKYLYKKGDGYRVVATKGNEKINKYFPKDQLNEARTYAKEVEEKFDKTEAKPPREVTGKKLTVYNKFAQDIYGKNFNELKTQEDKNIVKTRYKQSDGKFRKTFQTDALTDLNQERIRKAFPDVEFEFKKGQKYGVVQELKNGKRNPVFTAVNNFVNNDYKLSVRKALPVSTQRDIVANFELPKGVKEWNFDVKRGGYLYGIPDTGGANMNLGKRIINFVNEPKPYKIAADFGNAEGWLLNQMNRAFESKQNPNFIPKYDLVNNKKKIVGFTDNQYGGGKTYYALKKYADKFNGTMMTEHPDFKNTKKFIDIANRAKLAPNKVIKDLLIKGGVTDDRVTLNNLLQYMINEKGVEPTKRALVLHHKGGAFANPTRDFQILNTAVNQNIKGVELAMRTDPKNITPKNIKFLKDAGASITIDGRTYGGGPKTAIGSFKQAERFVQEKLKGFGDKEFQNLSKYLKKLCPGKASGGRVGMQVAGPAGVECGKDRLKQIMNGSKPKPNEMSLIKRIMGGAGGVMKNMANPKQFLSLRALLGPEAMAFLGAFEAGVIGYENLAKGVPIKEALGENWATSWAVPWSVQGAQIEDMRKKGMINTDALKKWAGGQEKIEEIDNLYQNLNTFDSISGQLPPAEKAKAREKMEATIKEKENEFISWMEDNEIRMQALLPGSAGEEEFQKTLMERDAIARGKAPLKGLRGDVGAEELPPIYQRFGPRGLGVKKEKRPIDRIRYDLPQTAADFKYEEQDLPDYARQEWENIFTDAGMLRPRQSLSDVIDATGRTGMEYAKDQYNIEEKWRQLFELPGIRGSQDWRGANGGIATLNPRRPHAIPPESGPMPQGGGLSSMFNRARKW